MASKSLLARLRFRSFPVPAQLSCDTLTVRIPERCREPGLRKFARDYLPVLLYKFPNLSVKQSRGSPDESSLLTLSASGAERSIDVAGKSDRALYCEVTGLVESEIGTTIPLIVKHKTSKRRKSTTAKDGADKVTDAAKPATTNA